MVNISFDNTTIKIDERIFTRETPKTGEIGITDEKFAEMCLTAALVNQIKQLSLDIRMSRGK